MGWVGWGGLITSMCACGTTSCYVDVTFLQACTSTQCCVDVMFLHACASTQCHVDVTFLHACTSTQCYVDVTDMVHLPALPLLQLEQMQELSLGCICHCGMQFLRIFAASPNLGNDPEGFPQNDSRTGRLDFDSS